MKSKLSETIKIRVMLCVLVNSRMVFIKFKRSIPFEMVLKYIKAANAVAKFICCIFMKLNSTTE
jgi:hypothetical protein